MSINTCHSNGGVVIFNGEYILLHCNGVQIQFEGNEQKELHGTKKGRLYLTTHRMMFVNDSSSDSLQSISFPFFCLTNIELQQPIFGANFIQGTVKAQVGSNWTGQATFKLRFVKGGAIEFGQAMLQAAKLASRNMPVEPPPYMDMGGPFQMAPPPAYMPPPGAYYGFQPPLHVFPEPPPANQVYMMQAPPPYPGLNVMQGQYPSTGFQNNMKAQEAAQSAYYDPGNPGYAYMPPPPDYQANGASAYPYAAQQGEQPSAPPSYSEATKKAQ